MTASICTSAPCPAGLSQTALTSINFGSEFVGKLVKVDTTEAQNGLTNSTLQFKYTLQNPVPADGFVYMRLPKANNNFRKVWSQVSLTPLITGLDYGLAFEAAVQSKAPGASTQVTQPIAPNGVQSRDY